MYNYSHILVFLYAHTRILVRIYAYTYMYTHIRVYLYAYYVHILVNVYLSGTVAFENELFEQKLKFNQELEGKLLSNTNQNTSHVESQEQGAVAKLPKLTITKLELLGKQPTEIKPKKVEMLMASATARMEIFKTTVSSKSGDYSLEVSLTKVNRGELLSLGIPDMNS